MQFSQQPPYTTSTITQSGPGCLVRGLYFVFIGWWFGFFWLHVGYVFCLTVILLPVGLIMLNRLPTVLTLRSTRLQTNVTTYGHGGVAVQVTEVPQRDFLLRAVYFIFIGWWAGLLWAWVGYILTVSIILLPVGVMMLDRLPAVLTLRRS